MSLISSEFFFFLLLVLLTYHTLPDRHKWKHLLVVSLIFYGSASLPYLVLIIALTLIDWLSARAMDRAPSPGGKRRFLLLGLTINLLALLVFKYTGFVVGILQSLLKGWGILPDLMLPQILLPLGISYYTFKKISYLVDVYRGVKPAERSAARLLLYVLFFPEVVAGPIDRAGKLLPQFGTVSGFDYGELVRGGQQMLWGLFKKLVIADRLATLVNTVYDKPETFTGPSLVLATLFFSIQIYCDFSGYSDMAIGIGRMLGYRLMDNFRRPYFATSVADFWTRWHISFSLWLRDYLFLPLSYSLSRRIRRNRVLGLRTETAAYLYGTILTFVLCGLWHGAAWNFIFWGLLHGMYLSASILTRKTRKRLKKKIGLKKHSRLNHSLQGTTTFFLVTFAWIFFKSATIERGFSIVGRLGTGWDFPHTAESIKSILMPGISPSEFYISLLVIMILVVIEIVQGKHDLRVWINARPAWLRWTVYYLTVMSVLLFGIFKTEVFIYEMF